MQRPVGERGTPGAVTRLTPLGSLLGVLAVWESMARANPRASAYLPPPTSIVGHAVGLIAKQTFWHHIAASMSALIAGLALAAIFGIGFATASYRWHVVRATLSLPVEFLRGLAPIALLPAFMLLFGIGRPSEIAVIVWVAWVPLYINVLAGCDNVDRELVLAAHSLGANTWWTLRAVVIPGMVPFFLTGLRLSVGAALLSLVAAEMLGSNAGIGFFILESSQTFHIADMYGAIMILGVIGTLINQGIVLWGANALRWRGENGV